ERIKAFVSILPQAYLVQRIGGDHVEVRVLVGEGQEPHTFEPTPAQMAALAQSDVYFTIGVPFETALLLRIRSLFPHLGITDTLRGVRLRYFSEEHETHAHHLIDAHAHGDRTPDPHTWLDPGRVKIMAENIALCLKNLDPRHSGEFERNLKRLGQDLDRADAQISRILEPLKGQRIYVMHPAFGYFCEAYGLEQIALESEGKEPGARQVARIIEMARNEGVKVIFVQSQFSEKTARAIAESIGGVVVPINPLPKDYLPEIVSLAEEIQRALFPGP
ncbi:MAG: zinc ABC transporter substrate-binding protein, partial [Desulfomonilia bacterium]|nr:zinc ABC transporter substrate-binding protein [Desulfomonilia bacterium]